MSENIDAYLTSRRETIDRALDEFLPPPETRPRAIHEAMRYAVLGGGKRIRPILALAAAEACGCEITPILRHLSAVELIHTYSLVHDDLPAIDDDDLRRGRKTTHVVFGEAMAILAGDALLTEAFSWLAVPAPSLDPARQLHAIEVLARAIDSRGMIGGQVADIESERLHESSNDRQMLAETLDFIHRNKTGRLLTASVLLGGFLGGATDEQLRALRQYGEAIGLAFQIVDDLLDEEETAATLGKTAGKDRAQGKLTFPALYGREKARVDVENLLQTALASADMISGPVNYLGPIARYVCGRRS